jgi:hypothetical protein
MYRHVQQSEDVSILGDLSGSNRNPKTLTLPDRTSTCFVVISILNGEGSVLHIVVQNTSSSSRKQTSLLEVDLINISPGTREDLLLHVRHKQPGRREADILSNNNLALTLASQSESASDGKAGDSLLCASDAPKVEALQ